jgi:arginase
MLPHEDVVKQFKIIGAAVGTSAGIEGCEKAPDLVHAQLPYLAPLWTDTIRYRSSSPANASPTNEARLRDLAVFSWRLAGLTREVLASGAPFLTFGGDHSCAIGTWSGVAQKYEHFGLIWIDAHMDAHTPETSPSGNPHGMPVACLLGHGDPRLVDIGGRRPKIKPENLVLIGVRSYEPAEAALLSRLGVRVYAIDEVKRLGFAHCLLSAQRSFTDRGLSYGLSVDFDGLEPEDFPALGTPVENGIGLEELTAALDQLDFSRLIGMEFAEYNPHLEPGQLVGIAAIDRILHHIPGLITHAKTPQAAGNF